MAVDFRFKFPLPNGLHARPASHFEALTSRFRSSITLIHEKTLYRANARSVLSMVGADVKYDDLCCIHVDGDDEQPAIEAVRRFLKDELPHCDEALPELPSDEQAFPRSLKAAGLTRYVRGKAVCGGIGTGKVVIVGAVEMPRGFENDKATDPALEQQRASAAIASVTKELQKKIDTSTLHQEAEVLKAHLSIVRDVALWDIISDLVLTKHRTAAQAIAAACSNFSDTLRNSQSAYLRERVLDVEDICIQLLEKVIKPEGESSSSDAGSSSNGNGHASPRRGTVLTEPSICVADHLTPGQFLSLDRSLVKGLVLSEGGTTSHTVILARSMNIPTLVGVSRSPSIWPGREVLVDGNLGILVTDLPEPVRRYYDMERSRLVARQAQLEAFRQKDGMTADGHPLEIGANIASAEEATIAFESGAQGIGLFRTEMLFMDRECAPTEQEQTRIYTAAAKAGNGKPVIIRLLDIGGDKPAPYLKLDKEENPFLGYRGARLYREFSELVKTQLRAILQASLAGNVKILVPMVCCLEEVHDIKQMLNEAADELRAAGVVLDKIPSLGVMIEIPSLGFLMPELCSELDFFSVGSNDLIQYFLAADRANQKVAPLYKWSHPSFLRLIKSVIDQAHEHGKWVGLCGEMGDAPAALPLLIGLGFDEISMSSPRIGAVKAAVGGSSFEHCKSITAAALKEGKREAVESLLAGATMAQKGAALLSADLIIDADGITKEEVIKQLSDRLYLSGRVAEPQLLEEAIWKREETYSTGFGHGFALPHCKTDHLAANSIVIARLAKPIEWGSLDNKPVDVVVLLAIREKEHGKAHMKIFAKLSRLIMRDEFRDGLRAQSDPKKVVAFLTENLGPDALAAS